MGMQALPEASDTMTSPVPSSPGTPDEGRGPKRDRTMRLLNDTDYDFVLAGFHGLLPLAANTEEHLRGVVEDALEHPGSMVRAQLAYSIMRHCGVDTIRARSAAVAIEYFHTASLIFDDLPAMDNAGERRGRPCPHVVFGEAAAQLGALALINQGYGLLWGVVDTLSLKQRRRASDLVTTSLGIGGVLNGQARDLHFESGLRRANDVTEVAAGKTVPLIRLTLVLPALIGGAGSVTLARLNRLSELWGLSYQIMDDFKDCLLTDFEAGKSTARDAELGRPNLPRVAGLDAAWQRLENLMTEAGETLCEFEEGTDLRGQLDCLHSKLDRERSKIESRIGCAVA